MQAATAASFTAVAQVVLAAMAAQAPCHTPQVVQAAQVAKAAQAALVLVVVRGATAAMLARQATRFEGDPGAGGSAGFAAGEGSDGWNRFGGGGSGYGGAVFVRGSVDGTTGGNLKIEGNALFRNNYVLGGSSTNGGEAGQAAGGDLFIMKGARVDLMPGAGKTIRFEGAIADNSIASIEGGSWSAG